jgi:uncharacterized membrane protein YphA (DoxX/SURF4 family)
MPADPAKQTASLQQSLVDALAKLDREQEAILAPPERATRSVWYWGLLEWTDFLVKWGLVVIGGCLLLGLLTRTACVGGALFLLMFYLAMPPFPGLLENPRAEGHYLYINKNLIEMLALLTLATTRSGRWVGLDGLFQLFKRDRAEERLAFAATAPAPEPIPEVLPTTTARSPDGGVVTTPSLSGPPSSKESSHGT